MYRCKGLTAERKRCKRKTGRKDDYCPIHEEQRLSGPPLEIDAEVAVPDIADFKDGDLTQRQCGHCCDLTLEKCCECTDARAADAVPVELRGNNYCKQCKMRYIDRLPRPSREEAPRNLVWFHGENPEDNIAFNMFLQIYGRRLGL